MFVRAIQVVLVVGLVTTASWWLLFRPAEPEYQDVTTFPSPGGRWLATAETVVYGDHFSVNVAQYEVRLIDSNSPKDGVIVYSVPASSGSAISVQWIGSNRLIIKDLAGSLVKSIRKPCCDVEIVYESQ